MGSIDRLKLVKHKDGVSNHDWDLVNAKLIDMAIFVLNWAEEHKLPVVFTSIIRPKLPVSKSNTHAEGRAFDISVRGWTTDAIDDLLADARIFLKSIGAMAYRDGKLISVPAVYHHEVKDGVDYGAHFHFQVRP